MIRIRAENLAVDVTTNDLFRLFRRIGDVADIRIFHLKRAKTTRWAIVELQELSEDEDILAMLEEVDGITWHGQRLRVKQESSWE